jgi:hypothetical protein
MPAKTVADLVAFNKIVSPEDKAYVDIKNTSYGIEIDFTDSYGNGYGQTHSKRLKYYNKTNHKWEVDPATVGGITKLLEPDSDKPVFPWGGVNAHRNRKADSYPCHNAWVLGSSAVAKGYGPMMYDCLLVVLGKKGHGLTSDRDLVSATASSIWVNYFENRSDVIAKPLDYDKSTPELEDDCWSEHDLSPGWNSWKKEPKPEEHTEETLKVAKKKKDTTTKAIAHAYFDNGITTVAELSDAGLLLRDGSPGKVTESTVFQLYRSLLREVHRTNL